MGRVTHEELLLFGERLRNRRNALGLTQDFVSDKIGKGLRFYQMIERGEKGVSLDTLIRLSKVLTISVDYLLFGNVSSAYENPLADILNNFITTEILEQLEHPVTTDQFEEFQINVIQGLSLVSVYAKGVINNILVQIVQIYVDRNTSSSHVKSVNSKCTNSQCPKSSLQKVLLKGHIKVIGAVSKSNISS